MGYKVYVLDAVELTCEPAQVMMIDNKCGIAICGFTNDSSWALRGFVKPWFWFVKVNLFVNIYVYIYTISTPLKLYASKAQD